MRTKPIRPLCLLAGFAVFVLVVIALPGCKSSSSPNDDQIYFIVTNNCGINVYVYWNGVFQFSLEQGTQGVIQNVTLGTHTLTAKIDDTDVIVVSTPVIIEHTGEYNYTIEGQSLIRITNHYGEILSITMNAFYLGDIADKLTHTLRKVPFGDFLFEARVKGDETIVASTTIKVDDIATYSWVITR